MFYKKAFTHLWVAGPFQYEYAKRLGYKNSEIVFNFLSADLPLFNAIYNNTISEKKQKYPHQFLFAGRFAPEKGLDILVAAWNKIENKKDWKLTLVGNGPLKEKLPDVFFDSNSRKIRIDWRSNWLGVIHFDKPSIYNIS